MRIIGGKFKGHRIKSPNGIKMRPTGSMVRESLFNMLLHNAICSLENARVMDLFSGTGALGLEALSRGASFCQFIEESAAARGLIRENADLLGVIGQCKIWRRDATKLGICAPSLPFDIIFIDPPYRTGLGERALSAISYGGWLKKGGLAILEEDAGTTIDPPADWQLIEERLYGGTKIQFYT